MAHPRLQAHRALYQRRVTGVRSQLAQAEREQLADPNLTPAQVKRNIKHLRSVAQGRLAQLAAEFDAGKPKLLRAIVADLYRLPPKVGADLSFRDAVDRASAVQSQDDALTLFERARLFDDPIMVQALAYVACPQPWTDQPPRWPAVVARWKASDPVVREALAEFDEVWTELQDKNVTYTDSTMFSMPTEQQPPDTDQLPRLPQLGDSPDAHEPPAAS